MRLPAALALILISIAFTQCQPVVPQLKNLNALSSLRPQLQNFLGQLNTIIPNIHELLNDDKFQQLQQQFLATVLNGMGNHWSTATLAANLQQLFTQFIPQVSQMRIDWWGLAQQAGEFALDNLSTIISVGSWLIGKRDATDARFNFDAVFSFIPNIHELLNDDKFQQLQQQFLATVLNGMGNHWSTGTLATNLQQLITQFIPQASQMRIDWWGLAESAGQLVLDNIPTIISVGSWLIGKRDATEARFNFDAVLSFIPNIHELLNDDKFQQLQQQFLATVLNGMGNHWSTGTLATNLQQLITQFIPQASQMRIDWWGLAESAGQLVLDNIPTIISVGSWLIG